MLSGKSDQLAYKDDSVLVIIDIQDRLYPHIEDNEKLSKNVVKLIKTSILFDIPIIVTEQDKLGKTIENVRKILDKSYNPLNKTCFNCMEESEFSRKIKNLKRNTMILTGTETHICVQQTALTLLESGFSVHVVEDAVSSRCLEDKKIAIEKMRFAGLIITSTEMLMYELIRSSDDNRFEEFLEIVKSN